MLMDRLVAVDGPRRRRSTRRFSRSAGARIEPFVKMQPPRGATSATPSRRLGASPRSLLVETELLDLAGDRVAADAELVRGLDAPARASSRARSGSAAPRTRASACPTPSARPTAAARGRAARGRRASPDRAPSRRRRRRRGGGAERCRRRARRDRARPRAPVGASASTAATRGSGVGARRALRLQLGRQVLGVDELRRRHHRQPVADVLELAHVAGIVEQRPAGRSPRRSGACLRRRARARSSAGRSAPAARCPRCARAAPAGAGE